MGAAESIIRNVDKRTSRRENRAAFSKGIAQFRSEHGLPDEAAADHDDVQAEEHAAPIEPETALDDSDQVVRVFVRKRPIFAHELQQKEFDVVSCDKAHGDLYIHDARMEADMKGRFLTHHKFKFTRVFAETDDSDTVYAHVVQPLTDLVRQGGNGTALMYGQTGSGKTYTMSHIYYRAAWGLFEAAASDARGPAVQRAWVSFVELTGDTCVDSLNENRKLQLLTCPNGDVMTFPAVQVEVSSPQELHDCIKFACSMRATAATGVHDHSSRSHAICRVEMEGGNALTMVDLAGSEHRIDSAEHDAQRRKESAQINSSLMKLKECIRARARNADYIPYRQSKLTHLLRPSFVEDVDVKSRTVIIATVSPSSKDTEHSLNTIRHSCIMDGQDQQDAETRWVSGGTSTRQNLPPVDVTMLARQRKARQQRQQHGAAPDCGGPGWGTAPSKHHARDGSFDSVARAASQKKALAAKEKKRRQAEMAARKNLSAAALRKLERAREHLGSRQRERMNRLQFEAQERARQEAAAASPAPEPEQTRKEQTRKGPQISRKPQSAGPQPARAAAAKPSPRPEINAKTSVRIPAKRSAAAQSSKNKLDLAALRARVWEDPDVPDDEKEEYIVMLVQKARARAQGGGQQQQPEASSPTPAATTALAKPLSRHEQAQRTRRMLMEKEQRLAQQKLERKMGPRSAANSGRGGSIGSSNSNNNNNVDELRAEIGRLHAQLQQTTDQVAKFALKQQYGRAKATLLRMERQRKQAEVLAEPIGSAREVE